MDERALKRLLIIVAVSIIAIFLFKAMMSSTVVNLNKLAAEKKQASMISAQQQATTPAYDAAISIETPAASAVSDVTMSEQTAASGVSEVR